MGLIFKKEHIPLVIQGLKTQTRRRHRNVLKAGKVYSVKTNYFTTTGHRVMITRVRRERLGDISEEDAHAEGGYTIDEFKEVWSRISGSWNPDEVVWVYEVDDLGSASGDKILQSRLNADQLHAKALRGLLQVEHGGDGAGIGVCDPVPLLFGKVATGQLAQVEHTQHAAAIGCPRALRQPGHGRSERSDDARERAGSARITPQ